MFWSWPEVQGRYRLAGNLILVPIYTCVEISVGFCAAQYHLADSCIFGLEVMGERRKEKGGAAAFCSQHDNIVFFAQELTYGSSSEAGAA